MTLVKKTKSFKDIHPTFIQTSMKQSTKQRPSTAVSRIAISDEELYILETKAHCKSEVSDKQETKLPENPPCFSFLHLKYNSALKLLSIMNQEMN